MGNIANMAKAGVKKLKSVFGKGDEPPTPPTGEVPVHTAVGYIPVPEPKFRNPNAAKPMNRMVHVSKQLEAVPPNLQAVFGLPPFVVSSGPGNTRVLGRNAAKRYAARFAEVFGGGSLLRKKNRRRVLGELTA